MTSTNGLIDRGAGRDLACQILKTELRTTTRGLKVCRIACMILLGVTLAGCDKCGGWQMQSESQACREQAPRPQ
jgi:hypothetical protein